MENLAFFFKVHYLLLAVIFNLLFMKIYYVAFSIILLFVSCSKSTNSPEFMQQVTGRYLYNLDNVIEVYFKKNELFLKWNKAADIKPMKTGEHTFFVKEMNEKIQFLTNPIDNSIYICLVPKDKDSIVSYDFKKLDKNEKIPSEYFNNKQYEKALEGYLSIQQKDSLNQIVNERRINSWGYSNIRNKNYDVAVEIFKLNVALYPESANVYDSLAETLFRKKDTIGAIKHYKKALIYDSGNQRIKKFLKKYDTN